MENLENGKIYYKVAVISLKNEASINIHSVVVN